MDTENRQVVARRERGRNGWKGLKVQTSSYKISQGNVIYSMVTIGGSHLENVMTAWFWIWTWAAWGSLPLHCAWNVGSAHCSHTRSFYKDAALRIRCHWNYLHLIYDWTLLSLLIEPLYKHLMFWQKGLEIYLSYNHTRQALWVCSFTH